VDCDRAGLFLWDAETDELRSPAGTDERLLELRVQVDDTPYLRAMVDAAEPEAEYFDRDTDDPYVQTLLESFGDEAILVIPVTARGTFFGVLSLGVTHDPDRIRPRPELLDRLSGVVAQAATALQNGQLIDRVTHQALNDALTGLANRQLFSERLEEAVAAMPHDEGCCLALFYVDLDRFKAVNDAYGHGAGDELLRAVAERLRLTVRHGDTVARLGGDEFALLVTGIRRPQELDVVTRRITESFAAPFDIEGAPLIVEASIGRAIWPAEAADLDSLLQTADADMYRMKRDRAATDLLS
jgi:diguanylate cyclase (GGDEF)-like protein